jgi:hypothetical protein
MRDNRPVCHMICANGGGISEINPQNATTARVAQLKGGRASKAACNRSPHTGRSRAPINSLVIVPPSPSPSRTPAHSGADATILGHACSHIAHKRCIQANTLGASRRHVAAVALRRLATLDRHRP